MGCAGSLPGIPQAPEIEIDMEEMAGNISEALKGIPADFQSNMADFPDEIESADPDAFKVPNTTMELTKTSTQAEIVGAALASAAGDAVKNVAKDTIWGQVEPKIDEQLDALEPALPDKMKEGAKDKFKEKTVDLAVDKAFDALLEKLKTAQSGGGGGDAGNPTDNADAGNAAQEEQKQADDDGSDPPHIDPHSLPGSSTPTKERVFEHLASLPDAQPHTVDVSAPHPDSPPSVEIDRNWVIRGDETALRFPRKTLVMDMDQTMLHTYSRHDAFRPDDNRIPPSITYSIPGRRGTSYSWFRPGIFEFLEEMDKHFEVVLFTAGGESYARAVMKAGLDVHGTTFKRSFFQPSAFVKPAPMRAPLYNGGGGEEYFFFKDLRKIRPDLENILLIDDTYDCFLSVAQAHGAAGYGRHLPNTWTRHNSENFNAIHIPRWSNPMTMKNDNALEALTKFLVEIVAPAADVRDVLDTRMGFKHFAPEYNDAVATAERASHTKGLNTTINT